MRIRGVASVNSEDRDCFFSLLEVGAFPLLFFFLPQEKASTSHRIAGSQISARAIDDDVRNWRRAWAALQKTRLRRGTGAWGRGEESE